MVRLALACLAGTVALLSQAIALANDIGFAPSRSQAMHEALEQQNWRQIADGLSVIQANDRLGNGLAAYRIDASKLSFHIALADSRTGSYARETGEREGAVLVVNAGFFAATEQGTLYPVGYLRKDGNRLAKGWENAGGVLSIHDGDIALTPSGNGIPQTEDDTLQSKPMLVEPGGKWAMRSNAGTGKRRTILCQMEDGSHILTVVSRGGLTLFEAGWLMRAKNVGGYFNCDAALALDGGRSTQSWVLGQNDLSLAGIVPVHNFLVVRRRED